MTDVDLFQLGGGVRKAFTLDFSAFVEDEVLDIKLLNAGENEPSKSILGEHLVNNFVKISSADIYCVVS